jgi:hypothetical protein
MDWINGFDAHMDLCHLQTGVCGFTVIGVRVM